ncbi:MAG: HAMP domain-containing protein [Bryobacterales bacterium]|nr:HAMP domain-containing protein [Bryobacterales bacterium]
MSFLKSIRFRLAAWYTVMLLIGLAAFSAILAFSGHYALTQSLDSRLEDRVSRLAEPLGRDYEENEQAIFRLTEQPELAASVFPEASRQLAPIRTQEDRRAFARQLARQLLEDKLRAFAAALPAEDFLEIRDRSGERVTHSLIEAPQTGSPSDEAVFSTAEVRRVQYRTLRQTLQIGGEPYDFFTGASTAPTRKVGRDVAASLRWLAPLFLLLSIVGGYWLSARALRPIDEITSAAQSIGIHDLSQRLDVPDTNDELRRLAETWNGMLGRLQAAVGRLQQFTADASHELRTPTAAVHATAEIALRRERSPEEYRAAIAKILRESGRMTSLIDDLLLLARADQAEEMLGLGRVDLDDLVGETCDDYTVLAEQRAVRLVRELHAPGAAVAGDKTAIRRLVVVLLDNAIKYSPAEGEVRVSTALVDASLELRVRDQGPGIPPDALPHLFDRFYRADSSRARSVGGSGLGLALAKSIADRHRAQLRMENLPDKGAEFVVRFPLTAT